MPEIVESKAISNSSGFIGGKAAGLLFLEKNQFRVPAFYMLDHETLEEIHRNPLLLPTLLENWKRKFLISPDSLWAVRSSGASEDGKSHSFAGLFHTETHVKPDELEKAILKVFAAFTQLPREYQQHTSPVFGVVLQEMVASEYSGVLFSHNPFHLGPGVHINLIPGVGENLVSGKAEAFTVIEKEGKLHYENADQNFQGERYQKGYIPVFKTGGEMKSELQPWLPELVKGAKRLSLLKKVPVDIEFAIAGGEIYWLQVRPITTPETEEPSIWDNTAAEANYPGITLPLSISMVRNSFHFAYESMARFLGMNQKYLSRNQPLLSTMCGEINGGLYYHVTAWQKLMVQLPFGKKAARRLPMLWGMREAEFRPPGFSLSFPQRLVLLFRILGSFLFLETLKKKYIRHFEKVMGDYSHLDLRQKTHEALIPIYKDIESKLGRNWAAPMLNGFFTLLIFSLLKKVSTRSKLQHRYPNFVNDILFGSGDVISVRIVREFQKLLSAIRADEGSFQLFHKKAPEEIERELEKMNPGLLRQIHEYIQNYGDRSEEGELKMETVSYRENPLLFIAFLKENCRDRVNPRSPHNDFNAADVLKKEYPRNFLKRLLFQWLIGQTVNKIRDRENYRFMRTQTFGLVRRIFRAMDEDLFQKGWIKQKNDSLYLELSELTNAEMKGEYSRILGARKKEYEKHVSAHRANRYLFTQKGFQEVREEEETSDAGVISGIGCCSGVVKAEVCIINESSKTEGSYAGKILVAEYFEPGKLNLFSQAAGIITVRGNLLSHTAILCRELGIPSIVGAKGLLQKIKEGDWIEMNGATGKIKKVEIHEPVS